MNIDSRLGRIERQLSPGREARVSPPVIVGQCGRRPTDAEARELGPVETWLTYEWQLHRQEEANAEHLKNHPGGVGGPIFINLDVDEEYRAKRASVRSERRADDD